MRERRGKWYKERGKCIIKSGIEFPDPMLMTLDTPHGPNTKFFKKCLKNPGKIIFPPLWFLIKNQSGGNVWKCGQFPFVCDPICIIIACPIQNLSNIHYEDNFIF